MMSKTKQYPTYALITQDNEIIAIMPGSPEAARQTAAFEATRRGKAVHYFRLEGTASGILAALPVSVDRGSIEEMLG